MSFLYGSSVTANANAETVKRAYLDKKQNVHVVTENGRNVRVSNKGGAAFLKTAPDKKAIAWLVMNDWVAEGDDKPGAEELVIYRDGKTASIKCSPFIRDYWFWQNGNKIVIDCGGRRFAGREILYDTRTLEELDNLDQAEIPYEKRPAWSSGND